MKYAYSGCPYFINIIIKINVKDYRLSRGIVDRIVF